MFPVILARWSLLWAKLQIVTCRQALREGNVGPYTICDRSLSSTKPDPWLLALYIPHRVVVICSMWYIQVCQSTVHIWQLRMSSCRNSHFKVQCHYSSHVVFHTCMCWWIRPNRRHLRMPFCWANETLCRPIEYRLRTRKREDSRS